MRGDASHRGWSGRGANRSRRTRWEVLLSAPALPVSLAAADRLSGSGWCRYEVRASCGTPSVPAIGPLFRRRAGFRIGHRLVVVRPAEPDLSPLRCDRPGAKRLRPSLAKGTRVRAAPDLPGKISDL